MHERKLAFGQLRQRYKNNLSDMRGAHVRLQPFAARRLVSISTESFCADVQAREFIDISARIPSTAVSPRRSYLGASSSFRGTHMCRELQVEIDADRLKSAGALLN